MNFFSIKLFQKTNKSNSSSFTEAGFSAFEKLGFCLYFWINRKNKAFTDFQGGWMARRNGWAWDLSCISLHCCRRIILSCMGPALRQWWQWLLTQKLHPRQHRDLRTGQGGETCFLVLWCPYLSCGLRWVTLPLWPFILPPVTSVTWVSSSTLTFSESSPFNLSCCHDCFSKYTFDFYPQKRYDDS